MSLRVALIGAGYFAGFHAQAWQRLPNCELVAVCDLNLDAARNLASGAAIFADAAEMLAKTNPDLLDIATPPATHKAMIEMAIQHGIPAICQKPLAPTFAQAQAIAEFVERAGHLVVVHENFRFQPWYREAKRLLEAGRLGEPYSISFRLRPGDGQGPDAYLARQPYFQTMERFLIHETAIHFIDTFRYLLGDITSVYAKLRRLNPVISGEDTAIVQFDFTSGASGLFDGNRLARHEARNPRLTMGEMWLEGSDASLRLDGDGRLHLQPNGEAERLHVYEWAQKGFGGDCVFALQRHVVDHFETGAALENRVDAYLRNLVIEEAIYRSAAENRPISVI